MTKSNTYYLVFYKKYDNNKLEIVMSVHVDDVFMAGSLETMEKIKEMINLNLNIQKFSKVKKLLGVYY